jgi:hypothetical protein
MVSDQATKSSEQFIALACTPEWPFFCLKNITSYFFAPNCYKLIYAEWEWLYPWKYQMLNANINTS